MNKGFVEVKPNNLSIKNNLILRNCMIIFYCLGSDLPLLAFPEEQITNGKRGLLKFKYVPFNLSCKNSFTC